MTTTREIGNKYNSTKVPISSMAQQPHVPKFGNWDSDNIPYTVYFENARQDKNGVRMNPNDPEENPEAFMVGRGRIMNPNDPEDNPEAFGFGRGGLGSDGTYDHHLVASPARKPPVDQKHQDRLRHGNIGSQQRNSSYDDDASESADWSSTSGFSGGAPHNHKIEAQRGASVPRFGTWDEKDPTSGDGFTFIFNKVKEEKHNASANFPTPPQHNTHYNNQQKHGASSSRYKICCCIF